MWILTNTSELTSGWETKLRDEGLHREDCTDVEWFNLDTGSSIVLATNGGWRAAQHNRDSPSCYQVFHRAASGQVVELTEAMIGSRGQFLRDGSEGSETFRRAREVCTQAITDLLSPTTSTN